MNTMKRVLMDIDTNLFRLALLENGEPVEFYVERKQTESLVGNVYAGRVETVVPNLQAALWILAQAKMAISITETQERRLVRKRKIVPKQGILLWCRWRKMP